MKRRRSNGLWWLALLLVGLVGVWRLAGRTSDESSSARPNGTARETQVRRPDLDTDTPAVGSDDARKERTPAAATAPSDSARDVSASDADLSNASAPAMMPESRTLVPACWFWDDTGAPPTLDDTLDFELVEASDGQPIEPWSAFVDINAICSFRPPYSLLMPLPTAGRYRVTSREGHYLPLELWVPDRERPILDIVLQRARK